MSASFACHAQTARILPMNRRRLSQSLFSVLSLSAVLAGVDCLAQSPADPLWEASLPDAKYESFVFTPDGTRIAAAVDKGYWRILDTADGTSEFDLPALDNQPATAVAVSPDGLLLAGGQLDGRIVLYDLAAKLHSVLGTLSDRPVRLRFTSDGRAIVACGHKGGFSVWKCNEVAAKTYPPVQRAPNDQAIAPNGSLVIAVTQNGNLRLRYTATGKNEQLNIWDQELYGIEFSPDGSRFAVGHKNGDVSVWDTKSKKELERFRAGGFPWILSYSSDGRSLLVASRAMGNARLPLTYRRFGSPPSHLAETVADIPGLALHPSGDRYAFVTENRKRLLLRSLPGVAPVPVAKTGGDASAAWRSRGAVVASSTKPGSNSTPTPSEVPRPSARPIPPVGRNLEAAWPTPPSGVCYGAHLREIVDVAYSPDGARLYSSDGETITEWDPAQLTPGRTWDVANIGVTSIAALPANQGLVVGSELGDVIRLDAEGGATQQIGRHAAPVRKLFLTPDGSLAVSLGMREDLCVWDVAGRRQVARQSALHNGALDLAISPPNANGDVRVLTCGNDGKVRVFQLPDLAPVAEWQAIDGGKCHGAAFSADGSQVIAAGDGWKTHLWDIETRLKVNEPARRIIPYMPADMVSIPGTTEVAIVCKRPTGNWDQALVLWDYSTTDKVRQLQGGLMANVAMAVSPDGARLATGGLDSALRVWGGAAEVSVPPDFARITTERLAPTLLRGAAVPGFLGEGILYCPDPGFKGADKGTTPFTVESDGPVYVATGYGGERESETLIDSEELRGLGWMYLGSCPWCPGQSLYVRWCRRGESFRLKTHPSVPPCLAVGPLVDFLDEPHRSELRDEALFEILHNRYLTDLKNEEFEKLDRAFDEAHARRSTVKNGIYLENILTYSVGRWNIGPDESSFASRQALLEEWVARRGSIASRISLARFFIAWAWRARGAGYANTVTEERGRQFLERLERAKNELDRLVAAKDQYSLLHYLLIDCAKGLGEPQDVVLRHVRRSAEIDPAFPNTYDSAAEYFLPRWHGDDGDELRLASLVLDLTRKDCGERMYASIVSQCLAYHGRTTFPDLGFRRELAVQGARQWTEACPNSNEQWRVAAQIARYARDRKVLHEVMAGYHEHHLGRLDSDLAWTALPTRANLLAGEQHAVISEIFGEVNDLAFDASGRFLASATSDGTLSLWNVPTGKLESELPFLPLDSLVSVAYSPEKTVVVGGNDKGTIVIALPASRQVQALGTHATRIDSLCYAGDGSVLTSASRDGDIRVWDGASGTVKVQINSAHGRELRGVALSRNGRTIVSVGSDSKAIVWNAATGALVREIVLPSGSTGVALSADGERLAVAQVDQRVTVWTVDGTAVAALPPLGLPLTDIALSADGRYVAITGSGLGQRLGRAWLWDLTSQSPPRQLLGHQGGVLSVAVAPGGQWVATGGADWTIRLWKIAATR